MNQTIRLLLLMTLGLSGCVSLSSLSTTSIPEDRSTLVEASDSRFLFLFINFNNDYANTLTKSLATQCPKGRVEGILTKQEHVIYFPLLAHQIRVSATGYCVQDQE